MLIRLSGLLGWHQPSSSSLLSSLIAPRRSSLPPRGLTPVLPSGPRQSSPWLRPAESWGSAVRDLSRVCLGCAALRWAALGARRESLGRPAR